MSGSSGTDYSQQNSSQYAFTDLASISSIVVASVSHSFVSTDVGNLLNIASGTGFTAGFYQIVSVAAGQATLDRSPGTVGVGGNYAVGGSLATLDTVMTRAGAYSQTNGVNGNVIWLKGTLTLTAGNQNFDLAIFSVVGYGSTRGDGAQATIQTSTNSVYVLAPGNAGFTCIYQNIIMVSTAGSPGNCIDFASNAVSYLILINCKISGFAEAVAAGSAACFHFAAFNTEITGQTSHGLQFYYLTSGLCWGCFIHANVGDGIRITGNPGGSSPGGLKLAFTVVYGNDYGIRNLIDAIGSQALDIALVSSVVAGNTHDGITQQGTGSNYGQMLSLLNAIIYGNGGYGIDMATSPLSSTIAVAIGSNNAFGANSSGDRNGFPTLPGDVSLTGDPFTNAAGGDFSLNGTSGAGAACKAAGFQSTLF